MICNPREQAAQERGYGVIVAKANGQLAKFAEFVPKEYVDGLGKIAGLARSTCCPRHGAKLITFENGGAWQGPCPCRVWCIECAKCPSSMGVLASERGLLDKSRSTQDYHVCYNCDQKIDDPRDFTPLKVDQLLHVTNGLTTAIDTMHEAACAVGTDEIDGIRDDPAADPPAADPPTVDPPPPPVQETPPEVAPPKKKGPAQGGGRRELPYFEEQARLALGRQADPEIVAMRAAADKAAYEKKLADKRKARADDKTTLKRARETEQELESERADRAKCQKMLDYVLDKCHAEGWADRGTLEAAAEAAAAQE